MQIKSTKNERILPLYRARLVIEYLNWIPLLIWVAAANAANEFPQISWTSDTRRHASFANTNSKAKGSIPVPGQDLRREKQHIYWKGGYSSMIQVYPWKTVRTGHKESQWISRQSQWVGLGSVWISRQNSKCGSMIRYDPGSRSLGSVPESHFLVSTNKC